MSGIKKIKEYIANKDENYQIFFNMGAFADLTIEDSVLLNEKIKEMIGILLANPGLLTIKNGDTIMFPIIIRAFRNHGHLINSCMDVIRYLNTQSHILDLVSEISYSIVEAEFCALMASEIANLKL